jgi:hypothetical protein
MMNKQGSGVIYKVLKARHLRIKERQMVVLETVSMTTSYARAMEVLLDDPACLLVQHFVRCKEKRPLWSTVKPC